MPQDKPNILMIICHDIGQHCGCYGAGVETPNMDAIANDGVCFTNYHCSAAQCSPSRGSIYTGKYPHNNGLVGLAHIGWEYNPGEKTMQMHLQEAGYTTHLFGTQHETGKDPLNLGYDTIEAKGGQAKQMSAAVAQWLKEKAQSGDDQPWFACMGTGEPHRPYRREGYPRDNEETLQVQHWLPDRPGIREDIAGLNGLVWVLDEAVGEARAALEESGLAENTLLIFTTDHGTAMPRAKGACYDPGTKTALMVHMPGRFEGGAVHDELLTNCDFLPTMMEFVGGPEPGGIDGRSFLGLLDGADATSRVPTGAEYAPRDDIYLEMTYHDKYNPMRAIRTNEHKYIRNFGDRPLVYLPLDVWNGPAGEEMRDEYYGTRRPAEQLYDLKKDPLEMNDVAGDPAYAEVLATLRARVHDWMHETNDRLLEGDWPPTEQQKSRHKDEPNG